MAARYWELTVPVSGDASEGVTNFLWELGALGVIEEDAPPLAPRLRAFFPDTVAARALEARVREYLGGLDALGFPGAGAPRLAPLAAGDWATAWRAHFAPRPVGRRLVIAPPWDTPAANGRLVITIEPGRAFGTGQHGSTAGCLRLLEALVGRDAPARAVDLGTGSGILAIAAARLGVPAVLAIDDDPDAIAAAIANAARNGVPDRVRCLLGDAFELPPQEAPLVVANLLAAAHRSRAARYGRWVAPAGALLLGGILDGEAAGVVTALGAHGFAPRGSLSVEGWTTLELRRDATLHDHA